MKVVELPANNLRDIPAMLRQLADNIEAGVHGDVRAGACVLMRADRTMSAFGWGETDDVHSVGILTCGAAILANSRHERR